MTSDIIFFISVNKNILKYINVRNCLINYINNDIYFVHTILYFYTYKTLNCFKMIRKTTLSVATALKG